MTASERPWLGGLLMCPSCHETLEALADPRAYACENGHTYPVVGGIPRFVPEGSYADNFGFQWTTFRTTQLDDDARAESEETFGPKTGLERPEVAGATVLDVGCGMGRYADVAARWGAAQVVATDISAAVEAAAENLAARPNATVVQADLRSLPFAPGSFDVVFSIGVLHHTPSTSASLSRISRLVKPGGLLSVWLYSKHLGRRFAGGELLRPITSRMPSDALLKTIRAVQPGLTALKRRGPHLTRAVDLVLPSSNHADPEWRVLETFDWYSPRYHHKHTYDEVEGWFHALGFEDIRRLPEPVAVRGRRPGS